MAYDVFISHSSIDKQVAEALCSALEDAGVRCWIAPRDILPGLDYGQAIIEAIELCPLMILILSSHSNASPQVLREVERAVSKRVSIVPFRIEDIPLSKSFEYFISSSHWLDAASPPLEPHYARLVETVRRLLEARDRGAQPSAPANARPLGSVPPATAASAQPVEPGPKRGVRAIVVAAVVLLALGLGAFYFISDKSKTPQKLETAAPTAQPWHNAWAELEALANTAPASLKASLNKERFKLGDNMVISCTAPRDGYLNILNVNKDEEQVTVLFPNRYRPENLVKAGETVTVPASGESFALTAQPPLGETLIAIFLTDKEINAYRGADFRQSSELFNTLPKPKTRGFAVQVKAEVGLAAAGLVRAVVEQ